MVDEKWEILLKERLQEALTAKPISFAKLERSILPVYSGVYIVSVATGKREKFIYVGRTTNMQERLYRNHLMGNTKASSLKKYLCEDAELSEIKIALEAKEYMRKNCSVRFIQEDDMYTRGILEYYFTAVLKTKYGISKEH